MNKFEKTLLATALLTLSATASAFEPVKSPSQLPQLTISQFGGEFSVDKGAVYQSDPQSNAAGRMNGVVRFIADQLTQNRDVNNLSSTHFAIASIVGLDDVSRTNKLGFLIQEHLMHELQVRGFKVVDFKLMDNSIQVTKDGDFAFSRDAKKLKKSHDIANVVSGTYSFQADGVVLNIRAIDTKTGVMTSSAQAYLSRADYEYITTGREGVFEGGQYFYKEPNIKVVEKKVPYEGVSNKVSIVP